MHLNKFNEQLGEIETIVVDNASLDSTVKVVETFKEHFDKKITLIKNEENLGFTRGAQIGLKTAKGKRIFLLNPDTELVEDCLVKLCNKLDSDEKIGIVAPQLVFRNKEIQKSVRRFPTYWDMFCEIFLVAKVFPNSRIFSRWKMNYFSHNEEAEVDQPMGAALMFKRNVLEEINYLDIQYDMFFNDVDVCKRVRLKGYKIIFYPSAQIIHRKGISV
ncbi:MAG: glycosyltransferase, partial [Ignavibacteria bacterium]|nr:glycosyltransferase [Ignavibacteria bacterium]